jgi:hypothetical protein
MTQRDMHARVADDCLADHVAYTTDLSVAVVPLVDAVSELPNRSSSQVNDLTGALLVNERHVHNGSLSEHAKRALDDTSVRRRDCKHRDCDADHGGNGGDCSGLNAPRPASKRALRCSDRVENRKTLWVVSEHCDQFVV